MRMFNKLTSSSPISEVRVMDLTKSSQPEETETVEVLASINALVAVSISF